MTTDELRGGWRDEVFAVACEYLREAVMMVGFHKGLLGNDAHSNTTLNVPLQLAQGQSSLRFPKLVHGTCTK